MYYGRLLFSVQAVLHLDPAKTGGIDRLIKIATSKSFSLLLPPPAATCCEGRPAIIDSFTDLHATSAQCVFPHFVVTLSDDDGVQWQLHAIHALVGKAVD